MTREEALRILAGHRDELRERFGVKSLALFGSVVRDEATAALSCMILVKIYQMDNHLFDRIAFDPNIMGGRACIRGMRIPVSVIVGQVAHGATVDEILQDYPDLEREDIQQALSYSAWLAHEEVHPA